jgi:thymidylate kinase
MTRSLRSSSRQRLICLVGMDGTGKTAHARALIDHLHKAGIKSKYVWFGNAHLLDYPFMAVCRILGFTAIHKVNGTTVSEHKYYKNKAISKIWPCLRLLDVAILASIWIKLLLWRGFTVVCDRFVPDIFVNIMVDIDDDKLYKKLSGRALLGLMPRPLLSVCLDVDAETALQRKRDVPEIGYLNRRRNAYSIVCKYLGIPILNAEGPFVFVQQDIIAFVEGPNWIRAPILEHGAEVK